MKFFVIWCAIGLFLQCVAIIAMQLKYNTLGRLIGEFNKNTTRAVLRTVLMMFGLIIINVVLWPISTPGYVHTFINYDI